MEMRRSSGICFCFFRLDGFLNLHIAKLFGVKDFATFQALDIFSIFVPGDNTHSWVFADGGHFSDSVGLERFSNGCISKTPPRRSGFPLRVLKCLGFQDGKEPTPQPTQPA